MASAACRQVGRIANFSVLRDWQLASAGSPWNGGHQGVDVPVQRHSFHRSEARAGLDYRPEIHDCDVVSDMTNDRKIMREEEHADVSMSASVRTVFAGWPGRTRQMMRRLVQDQSGPSTKWTIPPDVGRFTRRDLTLNKASLRETPIT